MKILLFVVLLVGAAALAPRPPKPFCRNIPLPSLIPVTVGEETEFDLENVFSGRCACMQDTTCS